MSTATSLPNMLTYGRIVAVPAVFATYFVEGDAARWIGLVIFIFAAVTDYFDGYLARAWHQQSALGRMLDPIADKLLVAACLVMLVANKTIASHALVAATIILAREILVSGLREFLAELKVGMPVTNLAKWKTAVQLIAIGFLLAGPAGEKILPHTTDIGIWLLWAAAILTIVTGWDYLRAGLEHLVEDDR